jgi:transposase-like protein
MVMEKSIPVKKVARDLDIQLNLPHQWRRQFEKEDDGAFVSNQVSTFSGKDQCVTCNIVEFD